MRRAAQPARGNSPERANSVVESWRRVVSSAEATRLIARTAASRTFGSRSIAASMSAGNAGRARTRIAPSAPAAAARTEALPSPRAATSGRTAPAPMRLRPVAAAATTEDSESRSAAINAGTMSPAFRENCPRAPAAA